MNAHQVGADRRRRDIPLHVIAIFEDTTDAGLQSMIEDPMIDATFRVYARYELEYRDAFSTVVDFDPVTGNIRRRTLATVPQIEEAMSADEAARPKPADRSRWTMAGGRATLAEQMAAAPERTCTKCGAKFNTLHGPELCTPCWKAAPR